MCINNKLNLINCFIFIFLRDHSKWGCVLKQTHFFNRMGRKNCCFHHAWEVENEVIQKSGKDSTEKMKDRVRESETRLNQIKAVSHTCRKCTMCRLFRL